MKLDDDQLTEEGVDLSAGGRILLLACGALAHEILALKRTNGWDHMDLTCLPANLHLFPDRIPDAVAAAVEKNRDDYAVFAAHDDEITAFYLTDFLVKQFDAFVWKPMGLDRHPELRDMYFGNYTKLVYQAQTNNPVLDTKAEDCARRLGLAYERRFTGYGDLETTMAGLS